MLRGSLDTLVALLLSRLSGAHAIAQPESSQWQQQLSQQHSVQPEKYVPSSSSDEDASSARAAMASALGLAAKAEAISAVFATSSPEPGNVATLQSSPPLPDNTTTATPVWDGMILVQLPAWAYLLVGLGVLVFVVVVCVGAFGGVLAQSDELKKAINGVGSLGRPEPPSPSSPTTSSPDNSLRGGKVFRSLHVPELADNLHKERGVQTSYDKESDDRSDCVIHSVLAHAPRGAWNSSPRSVDAEECARVRLAAGVSGSGNLSYTEVDQVLTYLGMGVLLLDLSVAGEPWLAKRDPLGAPACALVLQVAADHWEPISHNNQCVLRDWEHGVRVARVIAKAPYLEPDVIPTSGGTRYAGRKVGWGGGGKKAEAKPEVKAQGLRSLSSILDNDA